MTFMPFLPRTTYHTLELNVSACKAKYDANHVPVELSRYIDEHACHGSSADVAVVNACSAKFGPFDVVIDDGSHMLKHTSFSFLFWLKSPGLVPGGYLIIEDLQVTSWPDWQSSALDYDAEKHDVRQPAVVRGTTVVNYAQSLVLCKLSGLLCLAPQAGEEHAMIHYVDLVDQIIVAPEAVAFRKPRHLPVPSSSSRKLTSDLCIALDAGSDSLFDRKAKVLALRLEGRHLSDEAVSPSAAQHLQARLGARGFDVTELRLASCASVTACLSSISRISGTLDLIVVEVPLDSSNESTWASQQLLIELIGSSDFLISKKLAVGGIVMINGYQPRSISAVKTPDARGPRIAKAISEPLLAFVADFIMQQLATRTGSHHNPRWAGYAVRNAQVIDRAIVLYSDMSIDSRNSLYLRRGDWHHRRPATPRDHLKHKNIG
ncbi:Hypothetical protein, putative [Bodo saltans]|uniref:Methyltransferase n=1 Tax=Bodo saltans TaxID=75058 RepID=A0A0S4JRE9_BODSA|nr:Hypothetical protein, putative [Bodo saltans]|eukprot:CUG92767.1 Hypothetical protein, putative [Bodo saltans]